MNIISNEPLSKHTTFKIGGNARYFVVPDSVNQLILAIEFAKSKGIEYEIIGNGSNILADDSGYDGLVIKTTGINKLELIDKCVIRAEAGAKLSVVGNFAMENCLGGFEWAAGIPGTVGGGVFMNCGAYGGEIKDAVLAIGYLDKDGNISTMSGVEAGFGYRHSIFKDGENIILWADLKLVDREKELICQTMGQLAATRREKQPLEYPSGGSTFKRPVNHFAAKLIEDCGLKGFKIGGAQVSEKHSGFVINTGGATCRDVMALVEHIKKIVFEQRGICLECEIKMLSNKPRL